MAAVAPGASYPPAGRVWSSPQRVNSRGRKPPKRSLRGSSSRITWETHSFHSFPNERCDHLLANERTYKGVVLYCRRSPLTSKNRVCSVPVNAWFHETSGYWISLSPSVLYLPT